METLKKYVADTVALLAYVVDNLPKSADEAFREVESNKAILIIPDICIGEFIYTILKQRSVFDIAPPLESIDILLDIIEQSESVKHSSLTTESWRMMITKKARRKPMVSNRGMNPRGFKQGAVGWGEGIWGI